MADEQDGVEIPRGGGDAAFAALMDTLVSDEAAAPVGSGPAPTDPARGLGGGSDPAGDAAGAEALPEPPGPGDAGPVAGAGASEPDGADSGAGDTGGAGADAGPGGGDRVPAGAVDPARLVEQVSGLSQKFEETTQQAFRQQALDSVKTEYSSYFDALRKHPRLLVGIQVPSLTGEDGQMETLRDAADAAEWQEAVKSLLTEEIQERAVAAMEENSGIITTIHQSIELFQRNPDLIPGSRAFDRGLADRFATMAAPYELRVDGRLHGYTIPVQPLIDQLRTQLRAERAQTPPPSGGSAPSPQRQPRQPKAPEPPQEGLRSKAGSPADDPEDFTTLFGTLGMAAPPRM